VELAASILFLTFTCPRVSSVDSGDRQASNATPAVALDVERLGLRTATHLATALRSTPPPSPPTRHCVRAPFPRAARSDARDRSYRSAVWR
jgi:hypothetical protein